MSMDGLAHPALLAHRPLLDVYGAIAGGRCQCQQVAGRHPMAGARLVSMPRRGMDTHWRDVAWDDNNRIDSWIIPEDSYSSITVLVLSSLNNTVGRYKQERQVV